MAIDRATAIKLGSFTGVTLLAGISQYFGLGEHASGLLGTAVALAGSGAHALFGHLGVDLLADISDSTDPKEKARSTQNHALHRLVGETIARILEREAMPVEGEATRDGRRETGAKYLMRAAAAFRNNWMTVELTGPETAVGETKVPEYFAGNEESIKKVPVLEKEQWVALVRMVAGPDTFSEYDEALSRAADKLREGFAAELWEAAEHAWKTGDLAWPALILRLLSLLLDHAGDAAVSSAATDRQLLNLQGTVKTLSDDIREALAATAKIVPDQLPVNKEMLEAIRDYQDDLRSKLVYRLEALEPVIGRERETEYARDLWLASPERRLLVWGSPGIGKSTLARNILRHPLVKERFGARRYELQCDDLTSTEDFIGRIARVWFGFMETKPERLQQLVLQRLSENPCAILVDNFETLMKSDEARERDASQRWLATMAGMDGVWLIVGIQGYVLPGGLAWGKPIEPEKLSLEDARTLFCESSLQHNHTSDPRLHYLIEAVDRVPHAIKLLGGAARGCADLKDVLDLWEQKHTAMFPGCGEEDGIRRESIEVAYDFAISRLDDNALKALRVLAWLPAGVAKADRATVLHDGLQADITLYNAAVAFREGSPHRLKMLKPLRDYVAREYPARDPDKQLAVEHFLLVASAGNELGGTDDGKIIASLAVEYPNAIWVIKSALGDGNRSAIMAACGIGRFGVRTGLVHTESVELLRTACDLAQQNNDDQGEAEAACNWGLGDIARVQNNCEDAEDYLDTAQSLFKKTDDKCGEALCVWGRGDIAARQNKYEKAVDYFDIAQSLFKKTDDKRNEGWCLWGRGEIARQQNKYEEAEGFFDTAQKLFSEVGEKNGEAWCVLGRGEIARQQNKCEEAEGFFNAAQPLFEEVGEKNGEARCVWCRGEIARMQNKEEKAKRFFDKALTLYREIGDEQGVQDCVAALGRLADGREHGDDAR